MKRSVNLLRRLVVAFMVLAPLGAALARQGVSPDPYVTRLEMHAILQDLNVALLTHDSATLTLDRWCVQHRLAPPDTRIVAERVRETRAPTPEQRVILQVAPDEPLAYRRVRLKCGDHILSEADNWYVPARLTSEMNTILESTDTAFGRVVQPLGFQRRTLSAKRLWTPLPEGWDMDEGLKAAKGAALAIPDKVLEHRAVLMLRDGTVFSLLTETYTRGVLPFRSPR